MDRNQFLQTSKRSQRILVQADSLSYSLHDFGLRTEIGLGSKDYSGKAIDQQIVDQMNSMRKWHSRIRVASPKERRLSNVLSKINEICSGMSLPKNITETGSHDLQKF